MDVREFSSFYDMKEWLKQGEYTFPAVYHTTNDGKCYIDGVAFTTGDTPALANKINEKMIQGFTFNSAGEASRVLCNHMDSHFISKYGGQKTDKNGGKHYTNKNVFQPLDVNENMLNFFSNFCYFKNYGSVVKDAASGQTNMKYHNMILPHCFAHSNIYDIVIPEGIEYIGPHAFYKCEKLEILYLPSTLKAIGSCAFQGCTNLKYVYIPSSCSYIEKSAFMGCVNLTGVTISNGVYQIGDRAFMNTGLSTLFIPGSVMEIGAKAFAFCRNLETVHIGRMVGCPNHYGDGELITRQRLNAFAFYKSPITNFFVDKRNQWVKTGSNGELMILNRKGEDKWMIIKVPYDFQGAYVADETATSMAPKLFHYSKIDEEHFGIGGNIGTGIIGINFNNIKTIPKNLAQGAQHITELVMPKIHKINSRPFNGKHIKKITIGVSQGADEYYTVYGPPSLIGHKDSDDGIVEEKHLSFAPDVIVNIKDGNVWRYYNDPQWVNYIPPRWMQNLNSQWSIYGTLPGYNFLIFRSYSNKGVNNSAAIMTIDIGGYDYFHFYIRSYAESNYDYVMAGTLDTVLASGTSYSNTSLVQAHTRGKQTSGTTLSDYVHVEYNNIDRKVHKINICYRKDTSTHSNDDCGYLIVPTAQYKPWFNVTMNGFSSYVNSTLSGTNTTYQSTNTTNHTYGKMRIDFSGITSFMLYAGSSSEENYDYICVSKLDSDMEDIVIEHINMGDVYSLDSEGDWLWTSHDELFDINNTLLGDYKQLFIPNDGGSHFITIFYVKDVSSKDFDDKGYVVIPNNQC